MVTRSELKEHYAQSTGTLAYHKLSFMPLLSTDGVAELAKMAESYWWIDLVASYQPKLHKYSFQIWYLVSRHNKGVAIMKADKGGKTIIRQKIPYTNFPPGVWKFYVIDNVLMLPNEN